MTRPFSLLALLALAACDTIAFFPPEGPITADDVILSSDRDAYSEGDELELTLRNESDARVETGVMGCALLERRTESGWTQDVPYNDRACILPLVYVEPGESYAGALHLEDVDGGSYRFVHVTSVGALATASFVVE